MDYQTGQASVDDDILKKHYYYLVEFSLLNQNRIAEALDSSAFKAKEQKLKEQYDITKSIMKNVAEEMINVVKKDKKSPKKKQANQINRFSAENFSNKTKNY